jgi:hypothetical protein
LHERVWIRAAGERRAHGDDARVRREQRQRGADQQQRGAHVDGHRAVEGLGGELFEPAHDELSGVEHEPVQCRRDGEGLEAGAHVVEEAPRRVGRGEVRADGERATAAGLDGRHDLARRGVAVAVVHGDGRAAGAERERDRAADPARRAGDEKAAALK